MADFCTNCSDYMFPPTIKPDIDVQKIFETLEPGYYQPVLCEGCGMSSVQNENGQLRVTYVEKDGLFAYPSLEVAREEYRRGLSAQQK